MNKNKVIIIGDDHTNTLGVIRTFGENGIRPYVFIISKTKMVAVVKSKYVEKYWICTDVDTALLTIMTNFINEKLKPVIISTSDSVTVVLDKNFSRLNEKFIVSNINNKQGEIVKYMDKYNQYKLSVSNDLKMATSKIINLSTKDNNNYDDLSFPCILKPIISAEGKKEDISICNDIEEFSISVNKFKKLNYNRVLYQEFINYDYELDISGYSFNGKVCIPGVIKKIRIWPEKKGSTTYGLVMPANKIKEIISNIEKLMNGLCYNGIFDIDLFICGDKCYLNEINFRNGALSYAYGNSFICYYWYLSNIENKFVKCSFVDEEYYFMDDQADLHNVIDKKITYKKYISDKKKARVLLEENKNDNRVSTKMKLYKLEKKIGINKFIDASNKVLHKDINGYLLKTSFNEINFKHFNNDYKIKELTLENYDKIFENENDKKEVYRMLKSKKIYGLILIKDDKIICRGFIKKQNSEDRYFRVKSDNSFIISHIHVYDEYREKNYQCDLILELIDKFANNNNSIFYTFIYEYNIPSIKNFEKLGFKKYNEKQIIRFMKKSIKKTKV